MSNSELLESAKPTRYLLRDSLIPLVPLQGTARENTIPTVHPRLCFSWPFGPHTPHSRTMPRDLILAIDQGTTNTKAVVIDSQATIVAKASVPGAIAFPLPGWVEQDPKAIWRDVATVIDQCLGQISPEQPKAIGI